MRSMCVSVLVVLWCVAGSTRGVSVPVGFGPCPTPPVVDNFQLDQYAGTWYEYERFPAPFEFLVKCGQAHYYIANATTVLVNNTGIRELSFAGRTWYRQRTVAEGVATIPDPSVPAKLVVRFVEEGNYWVLATDYNSYSLVYSCAMLPLGFAHYEIAWILTRDRGVAPTNLDFLKQFLRDAGVDPGNFFTVSQSDCDDVTTTETDTLRFVPNRP